MIHLFLLFLISISFSINALEINFNQKYDSFNQARAGQNQLKFIVVSTKVGLFSSDVEGQTLAFKVKGSIKGPILSDMSLDINSRSMLTDGDSRDEKLHDLCLDVEKFPSILIKLIGAYNLDTGQRQELEAIVTIRGKDKKVKVNLEGSSNGEFLMLTVKSKWSLSFMEIPDPSIAIAKLSDEIKIISRFQIPLK